ncbi:MAG: site-2 protease family protein [Thermoplasmatota archaeon]
MGYVSVILALGLLIFIHELGHFLTALKLGVPVERFSLGFGPKLLSRRWRGVEFRLSMIPFGGYVLPRVKDVEDFYDIPVRKRILFSLGGPAANFIAAYLLLLFVNVVQNGPKGDLLVSPLVQLGSMTWGVVLALGMLLKEPTAVSGAVGMVTQGGSFVGGSLMRLTVFTVFLSTNLGLFNLLPIPALDGGKILFALLEKVSVRTRKLQLPVTIASVLFLIGLMGLTTVMDLVRIFADITILS